MRLRRRLKAPALQGRGRYWADGGGARSREEIPSARGPERGEKAVDGGGRGEGDPIVGAVRREALERSAPGRIGQRAIAVRDGDARSRRTECPRKGGGGDLGAGDENLFNAVLRKGINMVEAADYLTESLSCEIPFVRRASGEALLQLDGVLGRGPLDIAGRLRRAAKSTNKTMGEAATFYLSHLLKQRKRKARLAANQKHVLR